MTKEILREEQSEILFFGEGVADQIKQGNKLVTIRLFGEGVADPNIDMSEGMDFLASCRDDNEKILARIVHNKEVLLKDVDPILLGLDGYFANDSNDVLSAAKVAVADLQQYYPERQVNIETPVRLIMFVTHDVLGKLSDDDRDDFCKIASEFPMKLFKDKRFDGVFKNVFTGSGRVNLELINN